MKTYVVLLVLLMCSMVFAQAPDTVWTRTISNHNGGVLNAVVDLPDGGVIAAGSCCYNLCHFFATSSYAGRISAQGVEDSYIQRWGCDNFYGGMDAEAYDIKAMPSGGHILLCGKGTADIPLPASLIRLSANDSILWDRVAFDSTWIVGKICVAPDYGFAALTDSASIIRLDSMGNRIWKVTFPGRRLLDIAATSDGGFVAVGADSPERYAFYAVKVNAAGDTLWTHRYPVMLGGLAHALRILSDDTIFIAGATAIPDAPQQYYGAVVAINQSGAVLWQRTYFEGTADSGTQPFLSIAPCREGGLIALAGPIIDHDGLFQLMRMTDSGDTLWTRAIPENGIPRSVVQTADSGYQVVGYTGIPSVHEGWMVKYTREGLPADDHFILHPSSFSLSAYPNPFNPSTTLSFILPKAGLTTIAVYDITGRKVETLQNGVMEAGEHRIEFNGSNLPSGLYFARFQSGEYIATHKLLLLK